jgi:DnaJ-class molecular chaperone with C-terminal Zn finger domain
LYSKEELFKAFELLEVKEGETKLSITKRFREVIKEIHPDVAQHCNIEDEEKTKELLDAWKLIKRFLDENNNVIPSFDSIELKIAHSLGISFEQDSTTLKEEMYGAFVETCEPIYNRLLIYMGSKRGSHWNGEPVLEDQFYDIEAQRMIKKYSSNAHEEVSKKYGLFCYPADPGIIEKDNYIVWSKFIKGDNVSIRPIMVPLQEIIMEYNKLIQQYDKEMVKTILCQKYAANSQLEYELQKYDREVLNLWERFLYEGWLPALKSLEEREEIFLTGREKVMYRNIDKYDDNMVNEFISIMLRKYAPTFYKSIFGDDIDLDSVDLEEDKRKIYIYRRIIRPNGY